MPGTPQARTPAKSPARRHPVRHRLSLHSGLNRKVSPVARTHSGPVTPPSSAKKKSAIPARKQKQLVKAAVAHYPPSLSAIPPPPPLMLGSACRHADTEGPLKFLTVENAETTPPRPSLEPETELRRSVAALCPTELCLLHDFNPVVTEALMLCDRSSSAEGALMDFPKADFSAAMEKGAAGRSVWSSPKKPHRAASLSSASLVSPTRALLDFGDEHDESEAWEGVFRSAHNKMLVEGGDPCERPSRRVHADDRTPTPLPATPERPPQVRYFRCAKPLQLPGVDKELASAAADTRSSSADDLAGGSPTLHICGNVSHEDPVTAATSASQEDDMKEQDKERGPAEHAPQVPDMGTTLLAELDEDDEDSNGGITDQGSHVKWNLSHSETALSTTAAAELATEDENAKSAEALQANLQNNPSRPKAVLMRTKSIDFDVATTHTLELSQRCVSVPPPSGSEADGEDNVQGRRPASASINTSFAGSSASNGTSSTTLLHQAVTTTWVPTPSRTCASYHHSDSQASLSSLVSAHTADIEKKRLVEQQERASPSPLHTDGSDAAAKHMPPSSGRGQNSSYGCTEDMNTPASHQTRRSTPRIEEEECSGRNTADRRLNFPSVAAPSHEATAHPADVLIEGNLDPKSPAVPLDIAQVRIREPERAPETKDCVKSRLKVAQQRFQLERTREEARHRVWGSAQVSVETVAAVQPESILGVAMKALGEAWLPPTPPTGLHHVNKAALLKPPYAPSNKAKTLATPPSAPACPVPCTSAVSELSEMQWAEPDVRESELSLLFRLYLASPSKQTQSHLLKEYFRRQHQRHVNWVRHFTFEFLYIRMVAVPALRMLEMNERRLMCMRRDLGIRDKIELLVLLAPRPRAPTLSASHGVFSAFRMALHALGGRSNSQNSSRASGSTNKRSEISKHTAASRPSLLPPPSAAAAASSRRLPLETKKDTAEGETHATSNVEPLFSSERCGSGIYSVPLVCELGSPPTNARHRSVSPNATSKAKDRKDDAAMPVIREIAGEANPPREFVGRLRGPPRPLNKTYSKHYKMATEKSNPSPTFTSIHLPRLLRSAPRTSSTSRRTWLGESDDEEKSGGGADGIEKVGKLARLLSLQPNRLPKRGKDSELADGRLRARERVASEPRSRTPPPPPTDDKFVDLRDEEVLRRFAL
ncbi:hypothetical protein ABL78_4510 [Leptomonas seymouri]|uniref:Uncharacterized protein n=1 Tax=Leptomonas seymouri TaxID=5684 RepID=A0A0N1I4T0_LEPSE|nr:hypothetical protein ABL78_4510 [Leptomonas seymouri]|eukprot:KPI86431.1 hypothetical protein ABL78_4510 [Leptomonas seymouri]